MEQARGGGRRLPCPEPSGIENVMRTVTDGCVIALLVAVPLLMGGRGEIGQFAVVAVAGCGTLAWIGRQFWSANRSYRGSGVEWLLVIGLGLLAAQLMPLPKEWIDRLSPGLRDLLPLWQATGQLQLGEWRTLSLSPTETAGSMAIYLAYVMFFLLLVQRLDELADIQWLLRWVARAAVLMSFVGLMQFLSGNPRFLGVYELTNRSACSVVRGTFQNENHFVHFISLGLGPMLWWLWHTQQARARKQPQQASRWGTPVVNEGASNRRGREGHVSSNEPRNWLRVGLLSGLVLIGLSGLLSFSRGGVLVLGLTLVVAVGCFSRQSLIDRRTAIGIGGAIGAILLALQVFGLSRLYQELNSLWTANPSRDLLVGRAALWRAMWDAVEQFYWTGTGVGSHRDVYPIYMVERFDVEFTHGENGYLPVLMEAGIVGLALLLAGIGTAFYWSWRVLRESTAPSSKAPTSNAHEGPQVSKRDAGACAAAILPGFVASCFHSCWDFVWYIPACMILTIALLACVCRLYQLNTSRARPGSYPTNDILQSGERTLGRRLVWGLVMLVVFALTFSMCRNRWGPARVAQDWDEYRRLVLSPLSQPANDVQEKEHLLDIERLLTAIVHHSPNDARAHLRLAANFLKRFSLEQRISGNAMELGQICDAALASHFSSRRAQDEWLSRAFGERRRLLESASWHSHRAVALSPTSGPGYLHLSELSFLESPRSSDREAYVAQAALVRPHHGQVLFVLGRDAALAGDQEAAKKYWRRAFRQDPEVRGLLVRLLADQIPAAEFIEMFEPDCDALGQLWQEYEKRGFTAEARLAAEKHAAALEARAQSELPDVAVHHWAQAMSVYLWLADDSGALKCQEHVVLCDPNSFPARLRLAQMLVKQGRLDEGIRHYEWCLRRNTEELSLEQELAAAQLARRSQPAGKSSPSARR